MSHVFLKELRAKAESIQAQLNQEISLFEATEKCKVLLTIKDNRIEVGVALNSKVIPHDIDEKEIYFEDSESGNVLGINSSVAIHFYPKTEKKHSIYIPIHHLEEAVLEWCKKQGGGIVYEGFKTYEA